MENKSQHPFWDALISFPPIKWFCNLSVCKKAMKIPLMQKIFNYEMITYMFYGVATTIINLIAYWLIYSPLVPADPITDKAGAAAATAIANVGAWVIAVIFAFITNKLIVFKSKSFSPNIVIKELFAFIAARLLSLGFETLWMMGATFINPSTTFNLIAKFIAMIAVTLLNYIFSKLFIFKKKQGDAK